MVQQNITYTGDLRCEAVHGPSQTKLVTDAPVDNMGKGESFSPTDLVATALSTCVLTTMAIAAKKHDIDLNQSSARMEKYMSKTMPRRIEKLECHITIRGVADVSMRERLERAAHTCPVHLSLHPDVQQIITIEWE